MPTLQLSRYALSPPLPPSKPPWPQLPVDHSPPPLDPGRSHDHLVHLEISCDISWLPPADCVKGQLDLESHHPIYLPPSCQASSFPSPAPSTCPSLRSRPATPPVPNATENTLVPMMPKKRRSLQSILVPPFFHPALSSDVVPSPPPASPSQRSRSHSAAASTSTFYTALPPAIPIVSTPAEAFASAPRNSPPSDLLDDDPFADLSLAPAAHLTSDSSVYVQPVSVDISLDTALEPSLQRAPRSPLANGFDAPDASDVDGSSLPPWACAPVTPPSTPVLIPRHLAPSRRPKSSGSPHGQVRPAYTRPAFSTRPSLPSLHTLAQMNIPVKVKRGRVGATLPAEPWSLPDGDGSACDQGPSHRPSHSRRPTLSTIRDSRIILEESLLYASPIDIQASEPDPDDPEAALMDRSTTPRASSSNLLLDVDTSSLNRQSKISVTASFDSTLLSPSNSDGIHSSPDSSFPPTPQLSNDSSTYYNQGFSTLFARNRSPSFFDDLAATLDDDYSHATSHLHTSRTLSSDDELGCDFEPGTSAQTLRSFMPASSTSHFRTSSSTSEGDVVQWTSSEDSLPLSPTTLSSASDDSMPTSSSSSDLGDGADFLSFDSDSSEDDSEYQTALLSRPGSQHDSPPRIPAPLPTPTLAYDDEPGYLTVSESSSVDIAARLSMLSIPGRSDTGSSRYVSAEELVDAPDGAQRSNGNYSRQEGSSRQQSHWRSSNGASGGRTTGNGNGFASGSGGGGRDDRDGNDDRYRRPYPRAAVPTQDSSDTSESEEESSDDYGEEERSQPVRSSRAARPASPSSTDDDVPLAQAIPGALRAQRTIRRQVKDEKEQKKRARSLRRPQAAEPPPVSPALPKSPPSSYAEGPLAGPSKSLPPAFPSQPVTRPRTKTLPSQLTSPFSVGELTKKLVGVQGGLSVPPVPHPPARHSHDLPPRSPVIPSGRLSSEPPNVTSSPRMPAQDPAGSHQRLRSMRSFHRPRTTAEETGATPPPIPTSLGRSATTATRRTPVQESQPPSAMHYPASRDEGRQNSLERARSTRSVKSPHSRRPSMDRSARPSADHERPPMPPLPSGEVLTLKTQTAWQQRLFVGNLQCFHQIEITSTSSARDVLEMLQNQGALDKGTAHGWMLWEVSQDFGMERPIRSFEIVADVTNSWLADKTVNILMAKKTPLAFTLSRAAIPSSSPVYGAYVQWEHKRGKWQKRWLQLREHSLWLSKRDTGKDQVQLCSVNNFDAYVVTRISKAPKSYVFAVKSTDNLSYFESTSDYVHTFSCDIKEGENFVEKILLARSYVLHQERNVLTTSAPISAGASLSRSGTRRQRTAQPLVYFGAPAVAASEPPPPVPPVNFEPGSLLAKRS